MTPTLLRAFRHPLIWLSIAVLLLNDHLLKALAPSWITGKLSDFAGLFFFPFLLGVLIQSAQFPAMRSGKRALLAGVIFSGAVFTAIKVLPGVNAALAALLNTTIALDPTDLLALLIFFPAWIFWRRIESVSAPVRPGRLAYCALAAGALASLATSPCPPSPAITRVAVEQGKLYAGQMRSELRYGATILESPDGGQTWRVFASSRSGADNLGLVWTTPEKVEVPQAELPFQNPVTLPFSACDPLQPRVCYRISGESDAALTGVEESRDGGATWSIAWKLPAARLDFLRRATGEKFIMGCPKGLDLRMYDLTFIPGEGGSTVVIAMGSEGLLMHPAGGGWERRGVEYAYPNYADYSVHITPTPLAAISLDNALGDIQPETGVALLAGLLVLLGLSVSSWIAALRYQTSGTTDQMEGRTKTVITIQAVWVGILIVYCLVGALNSVWAIMLALTPLFILITCLMGWVITGSMAANPSAFRRLGWLAFWDGLLVALLILACFLLWAFGVLPYYNLALGLAVILGLVLIGAGIYILRPRLAASLGRDAYIIEEY